MKHIQRLLVLLLSLAMLTACTKDDVNSPQLGGEVKQLEWDFANVSSQSSVKTTDNTSVITVTKPGEMEILCRNYKGFWFDLSNYPAGTDNVWKISNDWCELTIQVSVIYCTFKDVPVTDGNKPLNVLVTAGDLQYNFSFVRNYE